MNLWTVREPPRIVDDDGLVRDLLQMPSQLLELCLQDVSLDGLHWPAFRHESRLSALQVARINSLCEGAFVCKAKQGKFDLVKGVTCSW